MKYYSYPYYDPDPAKQVIKTLSEQEILDIYWDWWKEEGIKRWGKEHHAAKYMESLQKENEPHKYTIAEVPLDVPMSGKLYFPTDNRILC